MHAQRFAEALQRLEQDGDVDRFLSETFAEDAELLRPELTRQGSGHIDGRDFWRQYHDLFTSVRSEFDRVSQAGNLGVLEWCTSGTRTSGENISYAGVSLLDFTQDGRVQRFATYFDTAAFLAGPPTHQTT